MKPFLTFLSILILSTITHAQAEKFGFGTLANIEKQHTSTSTSRVMSPPTGNEYDVKFYRLWLRLNPDTSIGAYVKGNVTTYFTTKQANFTSIKFDLINALNADSVKYHGSKLSAGAYLKDGDTLKITIPNIATIGTLDSITVYYQGQPSAAPWGTGFVKDVHNGQNYIYTLSEPFSASYWWPCKLDVTDKADSLDLIINNPVGFKAAGNGKLVSEITDASGVTATWKHRYAIPAYLVATAVANYQVHTSPSVNVNGTIVPVYHYFFPETVNASSIANSDAVGPMISAFSTCFGDYPYKNEKYGHYEFGFGGGMEHSTFSGMHTSALYAWDIIAHELGHQWFGDAITCQNWGEIWINEGFAQFTELIAAEKVPGLLGNLQGLRNTVKGNALAYNTESTFRTDISSIGTIFSPSPYIYERGAMVLSMLRLTLGDTKFFQALKNYAADPLLKYGNASTANVKYHMETVSGLDLADFFDNWIYKIGNPIYNIQWGKNGKRIQLDLSQTKTGGSTATYFDMPIPIRIQGSVGAEDTTVIVFDNNGIMNFDNNGSLTSTGNSRIAFNLSFVPVTVTFDPTNLSLASASVNFLNVLPVKYILLGGKKESQNFKLDWNAVWSGEIRNMIVERSYDGRTYETIYDAPVAGLRGEGTFNYTDHAAAASTMFYRIGLQVDNEPMLYSNIIKRSAAPIDITILPNPADGYVAINIGSATHAEKLDVKAYTAAGILQGEYIVETSSNGRLTLDVKKWPAGIYSILVGNETIHEMKTMMVQH